MTDKVPEALWLAAELGYYPKDTDHVHEAAAELRRLHALNVELLSVLKDVRDGYDHDEDAHKYGTQCRACAAGEAIAKAEGDQQ